MSPLQIIGRISGDQELIQRVSTSHDAVREALKKELRAIGKDLRNTAKGLAPKSHGKRSKWSLIQGPLAKSIGSVLRTADRGNLILKTKPSAFYARFLEGGHRIYEPGQTRSKKGGPGGRHRVSTPDYDVRAFTARHKGRDVTSGGQTVAYGVQYHSARKVAGRLGTARAGHGGFVSARPFMRPAAAQIAPTVPPRLQSAVAEAMRKAINP